MEENVQTTGSPAPEDNGSAVDESLLSPETPEEGAAAGTQGADNPAPETGEKENGDEPLLEPEAGEPKEENPDVGAPESYSEFTLPEGFTLDDTVKEEMCGLFKSMNLSQAGAQKLVDTYTKRMLAQKESELEALNTRRMQWRKEVRQRPTYEAERALARKGMREVVNTPEEKALFTDSWMSDHPVVFGMFVKIGRLLGEDAPMPNGGSGKDSGESAEARFPIKL
jgi:hypothetical protein